MQTQTTESTKGNKGRNRGARKPDPKLNIGSGMTPKPNQQAITLTPQIEGKEALEAVKLSRATIDKLPDIVKGFHKANEELVSLKQKTEAKRGGLSDILFQLCKVGVADAPKPELRLAACIKVLDAAEAWERQRYTKANKLEELAPAKVALGSSWQTYKSQILRCVRVGLNPADFANGTAFREAANNTGNQTRGNSRRGARQTAGTVAAAETMSGTLESASLRAELSAAVAEFVRQCQALTEELQLEYAKRLHNLTKAVVKELKEADEAEPKDADHVENMA